MSLIETLSPPKSIDSPIKPQPIRLGVVSFLNTLPLIDGLENLTDLELISAVPSRLIDLLLQRRVDIALCSSIDYQRSPEPLTILPGGLLGSDGPTLTVRLFSRVPWNHLKRIHCDTDSHTSIALLHILLRELLNADPEIVDYSPSAPDQNGSPDPEALLLIGDKVITNAPPDKLYPHQLDLGEAWTKHTGLPFVFACWMTTTPAPGSRSPEVENQAGDNSGGRSQERNRTITRILDHQRRHNRERLGRIIHHHAPQQRWPIPLAHSYLRDHIVYDWTEKRRAGLEYFFAKAHMHGLIERHRPLHFLPGVSLPGVDL